MNVSRCDLRGCETEIKGILAHHIESRHKKAHEQTENEIKCTIDGCNRTFKNRGSMCSHRWYAHKRDLQVSYPNYYGKCFFYSNPILEKNDLQCVRKSLQEKGSQYASENSQQKTCLWHLRQIICRKKNSHRSRWIYSHQHQKLQVHKMLENVQITGETQTSSAIHSRWKEVQVLSVQFCIPYSDSSCWSCQSETWGQKFSLQLSRFPNALQGVQTETMRRHVFDYFISWMAINIRNISNWSRCVELKCVSHWRFSLSTKHTTQ